MIFKKDFWSRAGAGLVILLLISPLVIFPLHIGALKRPEDVEWLTAFFQTLIQAGASAFVSMGLALLGCRGLLAFYKKPLYFFLEAVCLLPCLIPPLLLVISLVNITEKLLPFPFGMGALIVSQVLTYTGLATIALSRSLIREAPVLSQWAFLHGTGPWLFLRTCAQTILKKDIKTLVLLIFIGAGTSLSLPLLTAGGANISLEFYIYKQLKDPALWPEAGTLILLQTFLIFCLCLWGFSGKPALKTSSTAEPLFLLPKPIFILIPLTLTALALGGLFLIPEGVGFKRFMELTPLLISSTGTSLLTGFGVGLCVLAGLILMALSFSSIKGRKFIASYLNPGSVLTGLAFLLVPLSSEAGILIKWIAGLTLLTFPLIYRFRGEISLEKLTGQVETARLLGAGPGLIFREILWPQCRRVFCLCAGLAGFWAVGDFAYTLIVSSGKWNLALVVYDLFSSYRLNLALWGSWLLLLTGFCVLLFWTGIGYVLDRKSVLHR